MPPPPLPAPQASSIATYYSVYRGVIRNQNGTFKHFDRQIDVPHLLNGYWKFMTAEDEQRAFTNGFHTPEDLLKAVAYGDGPFEGINVLWMPGRNDRYLKNVLKGNAEEHLKQIFDIRKHLGMSESLRESTPFYPIHEAMEAYWDAKWAAIASLPAGPPLVIANTSTHSSGKVAASGSDHGFSACSEQTEITRKGKNVETRAGRDMKTPPVPIRGESILGAVPKLRGEGSKPDASNLALPTKSRCLRCIKRHRKCNRERPCQNCNDSSDCFSADEDEEKAKTSKDRQRSSTIIPANATTSPYRRKSSFSNTGHFIELIGLLVRSQQAAVRQMTQPQQIVPDGTYRHLTSPTNSQIPPTRSCQIGQPVSKTLPTFLQDVFTLDSLQCKQHAHEVGNIFFSQHQSSQRVSAEDLQEQNVCHIHITRQQCSNRQDDSVEDMANFYEETPTIVNKEGFGCVTNQDFEPDHATETNPNDYKAYMELPCMDCGEDVGHKGDCYIGSKLIFDAHNLCLLNIMQISSL